MGSDLVVAPATAPGRSALAIVRFTGSDLSALEAVVVPLRARSWRTHRPFRVRLCDAAGDFDDGLAIFAPGPASYTGEDTLEVTCHGNPRIVARLVDAAVACGARLAEPGEFTRRAVVHGKLDLIRAEGVDLACRATSDAGLALARAVLDGSLGAVLHPLRSRVVDLAAEFEARLDHPEDAPSGRTDAELEAEARSVVARCRTLIAGHDRDRVCVEGARVALVGAVNAGKSSLFNAVLGRARSLVHDRPGTTRDVVEARGVVGGLEITWLDTAGERITDDPVEAAGLALARELVEGSDLVVLVLRAGLDGSSATEQAILERLADRRHLVVYNGIDRPHAPIDPAWLPTCALDGRGIEALREAVVSTLSDGPAQRTWIASVRQRDLLRDIADGVDEALEAWPWAGVAVAADAVTRALEAVDALTGADTREDVLDALFARFCIGK